MASEFDRAKAAMETAVAGASDHEDAIVKVNAGDAATVAGAVVNHTEITAALLKGAKAFPPRAAVYQQARDVRHLLGHLNFEEHQSKQAAINAELP